MNDFEKLKETGLSTNFNFLISKNRKLLFPPITEKGSYTVLSIKETGNLKIEYNIDLSNGKMMFVDQVTNLIFGLDIDEINHGKIYFVYDGGKCELFEVQAVDFENIAGLL
ncbi:MAG: hypothetical protein LBE34_12845 [Flavobacteriaceae bacterium]|jgi:hypothetical protein|nr:hypothetical protein [Flavobacteriaceae bacterium]